METNTQNRLTNLADDLQKVIAGAKELTDRAIMAQRRVNELNTDIKAAELKEKLEAAEAAEVERVKQAMGNRPQITVDPNMPLMDRLFPKTQPVPMPAYEMPGRMPIGTTNPVSPTVVVNAPAKPKNLTNEARALIQTGHSYERAVSKLQAKYPGHPADNVRRAVGRARDGR